VIHRMSFACSRLRAVALALLGLSACTPVTGTRDAERAPVSRLSLRSDGMPELTGTEISAVAGDSVIIRAIVEGDPAGYGTPVLSATDPGVLELRGDGSARVRYAAPLVLTATAAPKTLAAGAAALTATARLTLTCTMEARPGLTLAVVDSATGQAPAGPGGMRFRAVGGTFVDSLVVPALIGGWSTAWERGGTYSVTVDADGFRPWRADSLMVTSGLCHVRTTRVSVRLQRK